MDSRVEACSAVSGLVDAGMELTAIRYIGTVGSVSTRPVKLECVNHAGVRLKCYVKRDGDYHPHFREALCAYLAHRCQVPAPHWFAVRIPEGLRIPDEDGHSPFVCERTYFGTLAMDDHAYEPAGPDELAAGLPGDEEYGIYLLDAIVQNKDRTPASPNLLHHVTKGFMAIDHEFSLGARSASRTLEDPLDDPYHEALASSHVLMPRLSYRPSPCWGRVADAYSQVTHDELMTFVSGLPREWLPSEGERDRVVSKLNCVRGGMTHFAELLTTASFKKKNQP